MVKITALHIETCCCSLPQSRNVDGINLERSRNIFALAYRLRAQVCVQGLVGKHCHAFLSGDGICTIAFGNNSQFSNYLSGLQ